MTFWRFPFNIWGWIKMAELYESEQFIYNPVPVRVFCHSFDGTDIFTPMHWHRNIEFNLTTAGRIMMTVDGEEEELKPGEWCIVNSGELHANHWIEPNDHFEGVAVQIARSFVDRWLGENIFLKKPESREAAEEIENILRIFGEYHAQGSFDDLEKMELVFRFLNLLHKYCVTKPGNDRKRDKAISNVKAIVNYIEEHYQDPLDLNGTAEIFHYTPAHLSRMFKEHVGHNFYQYLQGVRLMHCVEEMKSDPNVRLLECAMDNGFPNVKSFIQSFKKSFGCTPSEWLKMQKN